MKRSWAAWAVGLALALTATAVYWLFMRQPPGGAGGAEAADTVDGEAVEAAPFVPAPSPLVLAPAIAEGTWTARLFFPAADDRLLPQEEPVVSSDSPRARATAVVVALLAVAPVAPRVAVFPPEVKLGKLLLLEDGTVIVDLRTDPISEPPQSGSTVEQLRIYAIVHSILRNVEEAKRVVLLWNGIQRPSLAGHVDTGHALGLRADLEAS